MGNSSLGYGARRMIRKGTKIRIISDNENYDPYRNKIWKINHIAHNIDEHQGYDESMDGELLVSCDGLGFSLYEYEFEVVRK